MRFSYQRQKIGISMSINNIAFVPMRSGSKSIIDKNIKQFSGYPLFHWGISEALKSNCFDEIIVSTDSRRYGQMVRDHFSNDKIKIDLRPVSLAADETSTEDVLLEFFSREPQYEQCLCILHQITSPFVKAENFAEIVRLYNTGDYDTLLSGVVFKRFIWDHQVNPLNYVPIERPRRQDMQDYYCENGALYAFGVKAFNEHRSRLFGEIGMVEMPEDSLIELDEPRDWMIAEKLFEDIRNA